MNEASGRVWYLLTGHIGSIQAILCRNVSCETGMGDTLVATSRPGSELASLTHLIWILRLRELSSGDAKHRMEGQCGFVSGMKRVNRQCGRSRAIRG